MERAVALKKLQTMFGKSLALKIDSKAPSREEKEAAQAALPEAVKERDAARARKDARYNELLNGDTEYQRLKSAQVAAQQRVSHLSGVRSRYKITVGKTVAGLFFSVQAQADSWEDIFAILVRKNKAA